VRLFCVGDNKHHRRVPNDVRIHVLDGRSVHRERIDRGFQRGLVDRRDSDLEHIGYDWRSFDWWGHRINDRLDWQYGEHR
jgi:hypothetical protein